MSQASDRPEKSFMEALKQGVLVVDGAMGTQLYERGVLYNVCFEDLNLSRPELVKKIHDDYVRAGAQVVATNTFGANALRLEKHGLASKVGEINAAAVKIAREAAGEKAYVAGNVGPSGWFMGDPSIADAERVKAAIREQCESLVAAGVDVLAVETMRQTSEIKIALAAAREAANGKIPVIASASVDESGRMSDGTSARDLAAILRDLGADVVGINCSDGPMTVLDAAEAMLACGLPVYAVPNAGLPRRVDERLVYVSTPEYFGVYARRMFKLGVKMVGGCCGTTTEHIKRIAAAARMAGSSQSDDLEAHTIEITSRSDAPRPTATLPPVPFAQKSKLAQKLADKKFVVSVEVNPPVGLDPTKAIVAAKMLKEGGVDVVNIADGARAQARMVNLAMATRVQREVGMETILHVCGRDRNLLGTLAHLLGANDLGVNNLVIITGDPPKMGDFPDASAVYDLDSIGILKLAHKLNHGVDPGGKPLGGTTRFLLATGAEPAALNYERELKRLEEKKAAGAELVMTQPVYDPRVLEKFLDDIAHLGLPVLVGLLPLASFRNAEFLHNEVPGMSVPEPVRERMRKAGTGPAARAEGVAIAREMLAAIRSRVAGAYIMPPLERYELALEVVDGYLEK